ncbi:MAG: hypothetical protein KKB21_01230 [Nanoarchaeota archaeon]|nr:hypothetical protein [Nanoarchaeota archaeon]MBU4086178.1 hypothetical protein [Nanoarchaeota archaeon]
MNRTLLEVIRIIFTVISIILVVTSIIMISLKLSGHSPTETSIIFSVIGILMALQIVIITILFQLKEDIGCFKEFRRQTIDKIKEVKQKGYRS